MAMQHILDWITSNTIAIGNLPANRHNYPAPPALADFGTEWGLARETLILHESSAVVEHERNVLINPLHPTCYTLPLRR
jgi:hypothetical protein